MKRIKKLCISIILIVSLTLVSLTSCANQKNVTGNTDDVGTNNTEVTKSSITISDIPEDKFPQIQVTKFAEIFLHDIFMHYYGPSFESYDETSGVEPKKIPDAQDAQELIRKLKSNEIDIALIESYNNKVVFGDDVKCVLIGIDATVFCTSSKNTVNAITIEQLSDIYIGEKIKNWSQIGGQPGKILLPEYTDMTSEIRLKNLFPKNSKQLFNITQDELYSRLDFNGGIPMDTYSLNNDFTLLCDSAASYAYTQSHQDNYPGIADSKAICIDNNIPTAQNILSGDYPYLTYTYAVVNKARQHDKYTEQMIEWLCDSEDATLSKILCDIGILNSSNDVDFDVLRNS